MKISRYCLPFLALSPASAQSTISSAERYSYSANAGWIDWNLSPGTAGSSGIRVSDTFLSGNAYAANFGWISFGSGNPANGHTYGNVSAADFGVNISSTGQLSGFAYGANIGWISFEQVNGQPFIDLSRGSFAGAAYSANIGWIPLATLGSSLVTESISRPDTDADGIADSWERFHFGNLTTANATSDRDGDGSRDITEYGAGTIPNDGSSVLQIIGVNYDRQSNGMQVTFKSTPSRFYRIEDNPGLTEPWPNTTKSISSQGAVTSAGFSLKGAITPTRFVRVSAIALPTAP